MRHLHKIFHENSIGEFNKVYEERFNFSSIVKLGMHIKPMNQANRYDLYYVPTNKMLKMISELYIISMDFDTNFKNLPKVAQKQFIIECISEELYNTNELEGIRSNRDEIVRSTKDVLFNRKSKKRFESMIKSYFRLLEDFEHPKTPKDIRTIYDDITKGEIDSQELPDGEIFRKETTYILKKSGSGKVIHHGITPESEIIKLIEKLLDFMNSDHSEVPNIIKVAVGHYYFGYIHPFYDGNGRISRFISSMYLSKNLGNICTLSLSRGCNKYKTKYLEAFEISNSIRSRGEMNSFIETFLEIIIEALKQMNAELKEKSHFLNMALQKIGSDPKLKLVPQGHRDMMFVLAQNHFFDSSSGLTAGELSEIFDKSTATIRKIVKDLLDISLVDQKGERPAYFCIRSKYFEE
ncbi:Fic family protein [Paenibacillus chungangensis]|uniref:Fic family protein n=1 Tax=Paenibacillus chungangensis TaxID=696535 RepID=A0ABW3HVM3_9BACL